MARGVGQVDAGKLRAREPTDEEGSGGAGNKVSIGDIPRAKSEDETVDISTGAGELHGLDGGTSCHWHTDHAETDIGDRLQPD